MMTVSKKKKKRKNIMLSDSMDKSKGLWKAKLVLIRQKRGNNEGNERFLRDY